MQGKILYGYMSYMQVHYIIAIQGNRYAIVRESDRLEGEKILSRRLSPSFSYSQLCDFRTWPIGRTSLVHGEEVFRENLVNVDVKWLEDINRMLLFTPIFLHFSLIISPEDLPNGPFSTYFYIPLFFFFLSSRL